MPERRDCSFCGNPIEPGTGRLYVKRDGTRYVFCAEKCQKNLLKLKRIPRKVKWTRAYVKGAAPKAAGEAVAAVAEAEVPAAPKAAAPKPKAAKAVASKK